MSTIRGLDSIENLMRLCPGAVVTNTGLSPGDPWHGFGGREDVRRAPKLVTPSVAKPRKLPRITEAEFLEQVIKFAKLHGWRVAHFRPARTATGWRTAVSGDGVGWPDLILVKGRWLIAAELKRSAKEKPRPEQVAWLDALAAAGVNVFIWSPEYWPEIEKILEE